MFFLQFFFFFLLMRKTTGWLCWGGSVGDISVSVTIPQKLILWLREGCAPEKEESCSCRRGRPFRRLSSHLHPWAGGYVPLLELLCPRESEDPGPVRVPGAKVHGSTVFYVTWDFSLGVPCCPSCSVHHHHAVLTPVCFCVNLSFHLLLPLSVTAAWQDDQTLPVRCVVLQHGSALQSLPWLQGERVPTCLTDPALVGS